MADLRMVPLGIGDAFSELYYSTSLALIAGDGQWLLVDCPHPIRKIVREAALLSGVDLSLANLVGVAVTHLHADHASGLEGLGYFYKYVLRSRVQPKLLAGANVIAALRQRLESELFDLRVVTDASASGPFTIRARTVVHGDLPACAYRVACGSRALGHSGDTVFNAETVQWLAEADLFVHEAGAKHMPNTHHTAYAQLAALPPELHGKMRIAHCADDFDVAASVIEPLRQGRLYVV